MKIRDNNGHFMESKGVDHIDGFKGFRHDMTCSRDKKYKEGETYTEPEARLCECGMHFCENPGDVLSYYPVMIDGNESKYAEVTAFDYVQKADTKSVTTRLSINKRFKDLKEFFRAIVTFCRNRSSDPRVEHICPPYMSSGDAGHLQLNTLSGNAFRIPEIATSNGAVQLATGDLSSQFSSGSSSVQYQQGGSGTQIACGGSSQQVQIGTGADQVATACSSRQAQYGDSCRQVSISNFAQHVQHGKDCVQVSLGRDVSMTSYGSGSLCVALGLYSRVRGCKGNVLALTQYKYSNEAYRPVKIVSVKVDGKKIKENTWYKLSDDGKFIEA